MYLQQLPPGGILRRPRPDVLALLLPAGSVAGFVVALHSATGSWNAWREAEEIGWDRQSAWPWQGLLHGWNQIWHMHSTPMRISRAADLLVVLGGLLLLAVVLRLRQWPEAVYLALNLTVLVCSTTLVSAPRYALAWFPGYLLVVRLGLRPGGGGCTRRCWWLASRCSEWSAGRSPPGTGWPDRTVRPGYLHVFARSEMRERHVRRRRSVRDPGRARPAGPS